MGNGLFKVMVCPIKLGSNSIRSASSLAAMAALAFVAWGPRPAALTTAPDDGTRADSRSSPPRFDGSRRGQDGGGAMADGNAGAGFSAGGAAPDAPTIRVFVIIHEVTAAAACRGA